MLHRIFLAINLPEKTRKELLGYKEKWLKLPARWITPENLHVTLVFLGNTSDKELLEVQRIAREIAAKHKQFSFFLQKIAYGPSEKQPRMIWTKGTMSKELLSLQKDLAGALGYQEERPFSLHITLARLNEWEFRMIEPEERPEVNEEISLKIPVSSLQVMESRLKRTGAQYSVIESIPLSP
ncbi:RNA 2',3'-cyclic phosphodiesterase [Patescibacteria group bacterium]|nr:RNA 2',3'-cyclic phosphodiesterase [Patescibacteria group bacterium]